MSAPPADGRRARTDAADAVPAVAAAAPAAAPAPSIVPGGVPRRARAQDARLVYARTPAGEAEMLGRGVPLPAAARRILMVIDGRRRVGDLPEFARGDELVDVLDLLLTQKLIELAGIAEATSESEQRLMAERDAVLMSALKRSLGNCFERALGGSGAVLDARISDSVSLAVLKRVLREGIDQVGARRGEAMAKSIIARVRPLFAARQALVDEAAAERPVARRAPSPR